MQGDTSITGNLNASGATTLNTLAVVGNATFGGDVSVSGNLTTATLTVNGHIVTGGNVPTVTISSAVDSNLNIAATIEGNDSAGTITITTPENLATQVVNTKLLDIVFNKEFGSKPKVITSAEGSDSATLVTYVETAKDNFKLGIINSLQPGKTYKLNYFVVQ